MIQIENNQCKASFLVKGAELKSLIDTKSGKEWMWQADPAFWGKTSPILFPIVGALKDNTYLYEGKSYTLPRHGFARDMDFDVREHGGNRVVFGLTSSAETRTLFPFDFDLDVEYVLEGTALRAEYRVKNVSGTESMWFSLGTHPAFAIEVNDQKAFNDYQLYFEKDETLHLLPLQNNLLVKTAQNLSLEKGNLPLSYSLFDNDALVMIDMQSEGLVLSNCRDRQKLTFSFTNFSHFGIWSAPKADFVCLEPWSGVADFEDHNGELTQKFGITRLAPRGSWKVGWKAEIE